MAQAHHAAVAVGGALVAPFIVTGLFRVLPMSTPTAAPFIGLSVVALGLFATRLRWLGAGLLVGAGAFGVLLLWLFGVMSDGLANFG